MDGIILFAFNDLDYAAMAPLRDKLVLVARDHPGFSSVCFDDAGAVHTMLEQLAARGIHDIAYLGVDTSDLTTGQRRLDAYLGYCAEQGLAARSALGDLSLQSGYRLAGSCSPRLPAPWSAPATPSPSARRNTCRSRGAARCW